MAGSPVKRARRAEVERVSGGRAGVSDPATRAWALERAEVAGDEVAAREANVNRATIRSWRARAAKGGGAAVSGGGSGGGAVVSAVAPVAVDGDELARAEAKLVQVRAAGEAALGQSVELARAGNHVSAQHAARSARDFVTAERTLVGTVVLLRESDARMTERQGEMLARALEGFTNRLALPWTGPVRELLSAALRRAAGEDVPGIEGVAERAAREVRGHYARMLAKEVRTDVDAEAEDVPSGGGICSDPGAVNDEVSTVVETSPAVPAVDVEIAEGDLIALAEIPVAWRSRFVFGADGDYRARVAWTRKVRADEAARAAAAKLAAEAEAESVRVAAEARASRVPGPAPAGWDARGGRRGGGPAGQRAGA